MEVQFGKEAETSATRRAGLIAQTRRRHWRDAGRCSAYGSSPRRAAEFGAAWWLAMMDCGICVCVCLPP